MQSVPFGNVSNSSCRIALVRKNETSQVLYFRGTSMVRVDVSGRASASESNMSYAVLGSEKRATA